MSIVEMSFVLPLLLALMLSIVDFGIFMFDQHTIQFATREGARFALVGGTLADESGNQMTREASIVKRIRDRASIAVDPGKLQISIYPVADDYSDPVGWQGSEDAGGPGDFMRVTTTYQYKFITPMLAILMTDGQLQMMAQATYKNEHFIN